MDQFIPIKMDYYSGQINSAVSSTAIYAGFSTITSGIVNIPALTAGQIYNVPDLTFSCDSMSKLKMQFVDCNNMPVNRMVYISNGSGYSYLQTNNGSINTLCPVELRYHHCRVFDFTIHQLSCITLFP
jgi:hypothetical protein